MLDESEHLKTEVEKTLTLLSSQINVLSDGLCQEVLQPSDSLQPVQVRTVLYQKMKLPAYSRIYTCSSVLGL